MNIKLPNQIVILLTILLSQSAIIQAGWKGEGYDQNGLLKISKDYFVAAAATGGDFYFWAPGEFVSTAGEFKSPMGNNPILLAYSQSGGEFTQIKNIFVDSSFSKLSIFAGAQSLDSLSIVGPNGSSIDASSSDVSKQISRHMQVITITDPDPGIWHLEMQGQGANELAVRFYLDHKKLDLLDKKAIELLEFDFVKLSGRLGHQGYFAISKPPLEGSEQKCMATISGVIEQANLAFVSESGAMLGEVNLEKQSTLLSSDYMSNCIVPKQPFRVLVSGKNQHGEAFQRLTNGLIVPEKSGP